MKTLAKKDQYLRSAFHSHHQFLFLNSQITLCYVKMFIQKDGLLYFPGIVFIFQFFILGISLKLCFINTFLLETLSEVDLILKKFFFS